METGVLNSWVNQCLQGNPNGIITLKDYSQSSMPPLQMPSSVVPAPILRQRGAQEPKAVAQNRDIAQFDFLINSNNFNAFDLHAQTKKNSLYFMLQYMYQKFDFGSQLRMDSSKYQTLSLKLQCSYRDEHPNNFYHTSVHAADVVQNVYFYMLGAGVQDMCKATTFDLASLFLSAAAHDVDHPGNNNLFETKTHSKLALLYNDASVLEMHHTATFFFMMEDDKCNIFSGMNGEEYNRMRKYIVDNILFTDMSKHFAFLNEIKGMSMQDNFDPSGKQKPDIMKALVHAADVGNPARPFDMCKVWAIKILQEFFA